MDNRNNTLIPATKVADVIARLDAIRDDLAPFLFILSKKERQELPKMGDKSLAFVQKAAELAKANGNLLPDYVNVDDLILDAATVQAIMPILQRLDALVYDLTGTRMLAASEGFVGALLVYGAFQAAARAGQPVAQAAVAELKPRFARQAAGGAASKGKSKKQGGASASAADNA